MPGEEQASDSFGSRRERLFLAALAGFLVAALAMPYAATLALWTDELFSLKTASFPAADIIRLQWEYHPQAYDHPPLYFLILRPFLLVSDAPLMLRAPSLICIWIAAAALCVDSRGRGASLATACALAAAYVTHPTVRFYASDMRMYSLVLAESSLILALLWRLPAARGRALAAIGAGLAALLGAFAYTFYFSLLFGAGLAAMALAWIAFPRAFDGDAEAPGGGASIRRAGLAVLLAGLGAVALLIPWMPTIVRMFQSEGDAVVQGVPRSEQFLSTLRMFGGGKVGWLSIGAGWALLMTFGRRRAEWAAYPIFLVVVPCAVLAALIPPDRIISQRYLAFAIPILMMGGAMGWDAFARRWTRSPRAAAALAALAIALPAPFYNHYSLKTGLATLPDWWAAAEIVETQAQPFETIMTGGYLSGEAMVYHMVHPERFRFAHQITNMDKFYAACRSPEIAWYVNVAPVPPAYLRILFRYFPYRVDLRGNRGAEPIRLYAKRPFKLPWGGEAPYFEPVPLDYEENAKRRAQEQGGPPK